MYAIVQCTQQHLSFFVATEYFFPRNPNILLLGNSPWNPDDIIIIRFWILDHVLCMMVFISVLRELQLTLKCTDLQSKLSVSSSVDVMDRRCYLTGSTDNKRDLYRNLYVKNQVLLVERWSLRAVLTVYAILHEVGWVCKLVFKSGFYQGLKWYRTWKFCGQAYKYRLGLLWSRWIKPLCTIIEHLTRMNCQKHFVLYTVIRYREISHYRDWVCVQRAPSTIARNTGFT